MTKTIRIQISNKIESVSCATVTAISRNDEPVTIRGKMISARFDVSNHRDDMADVEWTHSVPNNFNITGGLYPALLGLC